MRAAQNLGRFNLLRAGQSTDPDPQVVIDLAVYARAAATRTTPTITPEGTPQ